MTDPTVQFLVRMPASLRKGLRAAAGLSDQSMSAFAREAIAAHVDHASEWEGYPLDGPEYEPPPDPNPESYSADTEAFQRAADRAAEVAKQKFGRDVREVREVVEGVNAPESHPFPTETPSGNPTVEFEFETERQVREELGMTVPPRAAPDRVQTPSTQPPMIPPPPERRTQ